MNLDDSASARKAIRAWARNQPGLRCAEKYVLEQLAFLADPTAGNSCYPTARWLGERCNLSERQARSILLILERHKLISGEHRAGRPTLWTLNLGVMVARPASASKPRMRRTPERTSGVERRTPEISSGVQPRKTSPGTPERTSAPPGNLFRGTPEILSDEVVVKEVKRKGRDRSSPEKQKPVSKVELPKLPELQQPLPAGERRREARAKTAFLIPVRDEHYDAGGKRTVSVGSYAMHERQIWEWAREYPALAGDPASGIEYTLRRAQDWCERAMKSGGIQVLRLRADLPRWLSERWLAGEEAKLLRRGRQQPLPIAKEEAVAPGAAAPATGLAATGTEG